MRGIKKLTVFSRKIVSAADSRLDLSAPALEQTFREQHLGEHGEGGKFGEPGPVGRTTGVCQCNCYKKGLNVRWAKNDKRMCSEG